MVQSKELVNFFEIADLIQGCLFYSWKGIIANSELRHVPMINKAAFIWLKDHIKLL